MAEKIVISKPGFNVLTETDPNNLIFSSDYQTLRYYASGTIGLTYNQDNPTFKQVFASLAHNLGYKPMVFCFIDVTNSGVFYPMPYRRQSIAAVLNTQVHIDNTTINFQVDVYTFGGTAVAKTAVFRYFMFLNNTGL